MLPCFTNRFVLKGGSVTSLHVLCVPVFLSLSLSLSRSNHLGLLHLQSAGGLSFAIRAVTSPTPQQIKVPATS